MNADATIVAKFICKFTSESVQKKTPSRLFLAVSSAEALSPELLTLLSDAELNKLENIKGSQRRKEYSFGRVLLRLLLQEVTGLRADEHAISTTDTGKPVCENGPAVSISHSRGVIACAASLTGDVGIDIECKDPNRDTKRLARRFFSSFENDWLDGQPTDSFYALWVLKEACLKVLGSGLAGGLDKLQCRIEPPSIETAPGFPIACRLNLFKMPDAYLGFATTDMQRDEISISHWNPALGRLADISWLEMIASGDTRTDPPTG